ncbi:hypothetical protein HpCHN56_12930 [Helicobacter pylori]
MRIPLLLLYILIRSNIMSIATDLKKETACTLELANIPELHSAYTHHFKSNIVSCNGKFYTISINFKTKFKIFSLKSPPPPRKIEKDER